jgi:hypothetical protein
MTFISKYSNDKEVSASQFITELICENKARAEKKDLHFRFWNNKEWAYFFKNQIASANRLIKNHEPIDIIKALKTMSGRRIYSLRATYLIPMIQEQKALRLSAEEASKNLNIERKSDPVIKQHSVKKNILTKLGDLDNE